MKKKPEPIDKMFDFKIKKLHVSREQTLLHWNEVKYKIMQIELNRNRAAGK
ncbi:hypothetical protein [Mucilaginibacter sp. PPCGB 2223]|uniref:hypothetical protein n=1 Tax=Mucilaginibacter sp. PPCGB 2223 TaxID=1886027 RepID=UPI0015865672|nr:hypothetical protein [Mucilaginibacter sp. PPCGB 2223]